MSSNRLQQKVFPFYILQAAVSITCCSDGRLKRGLWKPLRAMLQYLEKIYKLTVHKLYGGGISTICSWNESRLSKEETLIPDDPYFPLTWNDTHMPELQCSAEWVRPHTVLSWRHHHLSFLGDVEVSVFYNFNRFTSQQRQEPETNKVALRACLGAALPPSGPYKVSSPRLSYSYMSLSVTKL